MHDYVIIFLTIPICWNSPKVLFIFILWIILWWTSLGIKVCMDFWLLFEQGSQSKIKRSYIWGAWVAQLVKHPTLDFGSGHDLTVFGFKPHVRLCTGSREPAWNSLSPLCPSPYHVHMLTPSLSQIKLSKIRLLFSQVPFPFLKAPPPIIQFSNSLFLRLWHENPSLSYTKFSYFTDVI